MSFYTAICPNGRTRKQFWEWLYTNAPRLADRLAQRRVAVVHHSVWDQLVESPYFHSDEGTPALKATGCAGRVWDKNAHKAKGRFRKLS